MGGGGGREVQSIIPSLHFQNFVTAIRSLVQITLFLAKDWSILAQRAETSVDEREFPDKLHVSSFP